MIVNVLSVLTPVAPSPSVIEAAGVPPAPFTVTTCPTAIVPDTPSTVTVLESVIAPFTYQKHQLKRLIELNHQQFHL